MIILGTDETKTQACIEKATHVSRPEEGNKGVQYGVIFLQSFVLHELFTEFKSMQPVLAAIASAVDIQSSTNHNPLIFAHYMKPVHYHAAGMLTSY